MKKYLLIAAILCCNYGFSQTMYASLGAGSDLNSVRIYLMPTATQNPATFSTLQFNVAIPSSVSPAPVLTVVSSAFTGVTWIVAASYVENGYRNYNIYTGQAGYTLPITANVEFQAMEVRFSGGPNTPMANTAHLVTLPDGGVGTPASPNNGLFYCTGTINSNGQQLYYIRAGVTVANGDSYKSMEPGLPTKPAGTFTSYARYAPLVALPIKLTNFTAIKKDKDALLTWSVENQDANASHFEIERSYNGTDFTNIGRVEVNLNSGSAATYNSTDANIVALRSSGVIYYRIKQVDKDGKFSYSEIRSIKLDAKSVGINLYPNPAKSFTNILIDLPQNSPIIISINDAGGKEVKQINVAGFAGINQKKIDLSGLSTGSYMIKVKAADQLQTISLVKSE